MYKAVQKYEMQNLNELRSTWVKFSGKKWTFGVHWEEKNEKLKYTYYDLWFYT